jgi:hypothetical protein
MPNEAIEAADASGLRLHVEFHWLGDRFGHVISAIHSSGEIHPLLKSVEGTTADNWPPSPPLQSLSIETLPDGRRAALLVGMAGGSHWSASIESSQARAELIFDLACRHSKEPNWLGSKYQRLSESNDIGISTVQELAATQEGIKINPRPVSDRGTTRWKFAIHLHSAF